MSSFDEDFNDSFVEEKEDEFLTQESIIFLIDGNEQMYENNIFTQCLESYKNIIRQKCSQNKKDKLGLFIYGTKETNCEIDHVMVLQKFDIVTIDFLKNINNILKNGNDEYKKLSFALKYSFYDILSYAFQTLHISKTNTKTRYIILLCTCNDNPCSNDAVDQRRIEHLISTFKDTQTELRVVGFSDTWNDEIYYKNLQIISGTFTDEDYRRIYLKDFEDNILNSARSICKLPWKITTDVCVQISVYNLVSSPKYPPKIKLEKDDNEILEGRRVFYEESSQVEDSNLKETAPEKNVIPESDVVYSKSYGGVDIHFKPSEYKQMRNLNLEPGIEILAFKPIACNPLYHVGSPYFVTYNKDCTYESKLFFMCLISKCTSKKVMPICKVVTKYSVFICQMIPSQDNGGFYMYKMPFSDNVRNHDDTLSEYIFNSESSNCPINRKAVDIFKKLMDHSKVEFNPRLFTNPKLEMCVAHIEALALDEKLSSLPPDKTLPPPLSDESDAEDMENEIINLFDLHDAVESENEEINPELLEITKKIKLNIEDAAENKKLHTLTVANLKEYLKCINESTQGNKSKLIDRIYNHLQLDIS